MTVLPIVERELRVGARNPLLFRSRFMVPLIGAVMLLFSLYTLREGAPPPTVGKTLLQISFGMLFLICLFGGANATADTISREKREGTLGFLFLTDLKGYDIVIGKLVSSSIAGVYSLFGILPVMCIIFLIGGVEWEAVVRMTVTCGNALFFSLSAGLLASVLNVQERSARGTAAALIVTTIVGGPLLGLLWFWANGAMETAGVAEWAPFLATSPVVSFGIAVAPNYAGGLMAFMVSTAAVHFIGWGMLGLACWLAPRTWQEKAGQNRETTGRTGWRGFLRPKQAFLDARRAAMLDNNAIQWLTNRDVWKGRTIWALWWAVIIGFVAFGLYLGKDALNPGMAVAFVLIMNAAMKLSMAGEACRWLAQDRESGSLELILTTTLSVEEIIAGQRDSLRSLYFKPFVAAAVVQVLFTLVCLQSERMDGEDIGVALYLMTVSLGIMAADYVALGWVGMWKGLSANPVDKARQQTVNALLTVPWAYLYFGMLVLACFLGGMVVFIYWPAIMLGVSGWWTSMAKNRLRDEFRTRAMERYSPMPKLPFWKRVGQVIDAMVTPDYERGTK